MFEDILANHFKLNFVNLCEQTRLLFFPFYCTFFTSSNVELEEAPGVLRAQAGLLTSGRRGETFN